MSDLIDGRKSEKQLGSFWIRDASGHRSVTVTILVVSFVVTTTAYILSIVQKIGPLEIRPFDIGACASYWAPILALYGGRKFSDAKFGITATRIANEMHSNENVESVSSQSFGK